MDGFNRGFVLLISLLFAAAALVVLVVTIDLFGPGVLGGGWLERQLAHFDGLTGSSRAAVVLALMLILGGAALLVAIEVAGRRREVTTQDGDGYRFGVSREGISRIVQHICQDLRGVEEVQSRVKGGSRGLVIECDTRLQPRFNPIEVGQRMRAQVKSSVESTIGIPVREITLHMQPPHEARPARRLTGGGRGFTT
jgi:hypothetical protein